MTLWIGKEARGPQLYTKAKSLKEYEKKLQRFDADNSFVLRVFKSLKKAQEGFDYVNYDWDGETLKKSNAQPAVELNRRLAGIDWREVVEETK